MTVREMVDRFVAIEKKHGLMGRSVSGYFFWPYMRFKVFEVLTQMLMPIGDSHPDFKFSERKRERAFFVSTLFALVRRFKKITSFFKYNPLFCMRRYPYLFALEPRIMSIKDRVEIPIMLDFFVKKLNCPFAVLSYASGKCFPDLPCGYRQFRPTASFFRKFASKKSVRNAAVKKELRCEIERMVGLMEEAFGVKLPVRELVALAIGQMINYRIYRPVFKKYLKKVQVQCLITSVHYHPLNMLLGEVAAEMGIKRIELMHGIVTKDHIAYNLPVHSVRNAPDEFFVWGKFWAEEITDYPLDKCVAVGYPLLDYVRKRFPRAVSNERLNILFISQGPVGERLSEMAIAVANRLPSEKYTVRYKLHPSEMRTWKDIYPQLVNSKVVVLDDKSTSVYEELASAIFSVGAFSTALIEGCAWGVKALVLKDCPLSETMEPFCKLGLASFVLDVDDLINKITIEEDVRIADYVVNDLFHQNAAQAISDRLNSFTRKGLPNNVTR